MRRSLFALVVAICATTPALGQITVPGADGSDGAFNPVSNSTVNLALAPTGTWNGTNASPGSGVYDPDKWAVVFRYSSVNIASGRTVAFSNHPSGAPMVWLVSGAVTINGTVSLSTTASQSELGFGLGGPGGFRGGGPTIGTRGLGPGGGNNVGQFGSYGTGGSTYGNSRVLPLIGGSGSASGGGGQFGLGGGGAILIAATGTITVNGAIAASSSGVNPQYAGSGGAIRIVCNRLDGTGTMTAIGVGYQSGEYGRIRFECNQLAFSSPGNPVASFGLPGSIAQLWPEDAMTEPPSTRVVSLGSINVPPDPQASFEFPYADVNTATSGAQALTIECKNIPTGSDPPGVQVWNLNARIVPRSGSVQNVSGPWTISGTFAQSTWTTSVTLPTGFSAVQVRASMPPQ